jgi:hypothetical protein
VNAFINLGGDVIGGQNEVVEVSTGILPDIRMLSPLYIARSGEITSMAKRSTTHRVTGINTG